LAEAWCYCTAFAALAWAVGFLVVIVPGGLGPRELLLQHMLTVELGAGLGPAKAAALSVVAVLLLRLVWSISEVAVGLVWYGAMKLPRSSLGFFSPIRGDHRNAGTEPG
jgi:uncharacterized membrane protein YbhN (UPF0104 family)